MYFFLFLISLELIWEIEMGNSNKIVIFSHPKIVYLVIVLLGILLLLLFLMSLVALFLWYRKQHRERIRQTYSYTRLKPIIIDTNPNLRRLLISLFFLISFKK